MVIVHVHIEIWWRITQLNNWRWMEHDQEEHPEKDNSEK